MNEPTERTPDSDEDSLLSKKLGIPLLTKSQKPLEPDASLLTKSQQAVEPDSSLLSRAK